MSEQGEVFRCVAPWEEDHAYACDAVIPEERARWALERLRKKPLYCNDSCAMRAHNAKKYARDGQRKKSKYHQPQKGISS